MEAMAVAFQKASESGVAQMPAATIDKPSVEIITAANATGR